MKKIFTPTVCLFAFLSIGSVLSMHAQVAAGVTLKTSTDWTIAAASTDLNMVTAPEGPGTKKIAMIIPTLRFETENCSVSISWDIAPEAYSYNYELQYSSDATIFRTIDVVKAMSGKTSCTSQQTIQKDGMGYYRIKVIGSTGDVYYGQISAISLQCQATQVKVYPTIAVDKVWIETPDASSQVCSIYSDKGLKLGTVNLTDAQTAVELSGYQSGIYYLVITLNNGKTQTSKILKTDY
ncbi:MAG: T9SS type A sorting domain-containing protein [Bacteroidetes bacterium]|nr:T9SS type A sorting domain-containing protein [Bacteroidota bacterium]